LRAPRTPQGFDFAPKGVCDASANAAPTAIIRRQFVLYFDDRKSNSEVTASEIYAIIQGSGRGQCLVSD
jgi:hypothetical protein